MKHVFSHFNAKFITRKVIDRIIDTVYYSHIYHIHTTNSFLKNNYAKNVYVATAPNKLNFIANKSENIKSLKQHIVMNTI
jgi:hypothetical protein